MALHLKFWGKTLQRPKLLAFGAGAFLNHFLFPRSAQEFVVRIARPHSPRSSVPSQYAHARATRMPATKPKIAMIILKWVMTDRNCCSVNLLSIGSGRHGGSP